jgi:hypothetical protein
VKTPHLSGSRALWNRDRLDLESDEVLAQVLDRGELNAWRELYALAREDASLRSRIARLVRTVPLPMPHFWLTALSNLGEVVHWDEPLPSYGESDV